MRNLTQDGHSQGIFFPKFGHFFSNFWKRAGETSPLPLSSYGPVAPVSSKELLEIQAIIGCRFTLKRVRAMIITKDVKELS